MNALSLTRLAEHTIDPELLPKAPIVLDAGSRGFDFTRAVLAIRPKAHIVAVEADPDLVEHHPGVTDFQVALVGDADRFRGDYYLFPRGGFANSMVLPTPPDCPVKQVNCRTISWMMTAMAIKHWDLVKLDIEGSEFEVLDNWPGPIATQITVEFHDYFHQARWGQDWFDRMLAGPLRDYEPVQNERYAIGDGCFGHWDSLFVLKNVRDRILTAA